MTLEFLNSFNIIITNNKNFSTSYVLQMISENLTYSTNYLLINTNSLEHSSIFNTIKNKSFTNLNTSYKIYNLVTNEYTLSYTIDKTFIKNYSLQYTLTGIASSILLEFGVEYVIIQCPRLKHHWY